MVASVIQHCLLRKRIILHINCTTRSHSHSTWAKEERWRNSQRLEASLKSRCFFERVLIKLPPCGETSPPLLPHFSRRVACLGSLNTSNHDEQHLAMVTFNFFFIESYLEHSPHLKRVLADKPPSGCHFQTPISNDAWLTKCEW